MIFDKKLLFTVTFCQKYKKRLCLSQTKTKPLFFPFTL
ncbi:hypothetical protein RUMGNA_00142 [Mediterraneibacter gnavus ATCC 29149]|uniref:Uncharacterized protein n=1 Tax=Mediterraneibacter gnavus (strain ATCC 29149 / DSM 114966 / JCM 6515 / VPI C7-9) TaxID=411470 RepID=A7AXX7_MEDG7|nr:hypothetical protein RUMGNA_00142 [Mediterraneibacter gnavus ATCC 29149]